MILIHENVDASTKFGKCTNFANYPLRKILPRLLGCQRVLEERLVGLAMAVLEQGVAEIKCPIN